MKKLILLLLLAIAGYCNGQNFANNRFKARYEDAEYPSPFMFEKIDSAKGTKDELFRKASGWLVKSFVSAKDVTQLLDKESGKIVAKGVMQSYTDYKAMGTASVVNYFIRFTVTIEIKEDRYRYSFSDYIVTEQSASGFGVSSLSESLDRREHPKSLYEHSWNNIKGDCYAQTLSLKKSLADAMHSQPDNW